MKDTATKVTERLQMLYDRLPGERRLEMGCGMFDDAKSLATAGLLSESPGLNAADLKELLFLRLFGEDFAPKKAEQILDRLSKMP